MHQTYLSYREKEKKNLLIPKKKDKRQCLISQTIWVRLWVFYIHKHRFMNQQSTTPQPYHKCIKLYWSMINYNPISNYLYIFYIIAQTIISINEQLCLNLKLVGVHCMNLIYPHMHKQLYQSMTYYASIPN